MFGFTHSHRAPGLARARERLDVVRQGKRYRPVIDLLKAYFQIEDRDDTRRENEKVAGKELLTLDRAARACLTPCCPSLMCRSTTHNGRG